MHIIIIHHTSYLIYMLCVKFYIISTDSSDLITLLLHQCRPLSVSFSPSVAPYQCVSHPVSPPIYAFLTLTSGYGGSSGIISFTDSSVASITRCAGVCIGTVSTSIKTIWKFQRISRELDHS